MKNKVIQFPTDLVQAEAKIDRAHNEWLRVRKKQLTKRVCKVSIMCRNTHWRTACSHITAQVFFPQFGVMETFPSIFDGRSGLMDIYDDYI
jgi:ubiquinone/menaquinone biosynthesis C-methylase UbiE